MELLLTPLYLWSLPSPLASTDVVWKSLISVHWSYPCCVLTLGSVCHWMYVLHVLCNPLWVDATQTCVRTYCGQHSYNGIGYGGIKTSCTWTCVSYVPAYVTVCAMQWMAFGSVLECVMYIVLSLFSLAPHPRVVLHTNPYLPYVLLLHSNSSSSNSIGQ